MPDPSVNITALRRRQYDAERMARLSPFKADREHFQKIADDYRAQADALGVGHLKA